MSSAAAVQGQRINLLLSIIDCPPEDATDEFITNPFFIQFSTGNRPDKASQAVSGLALVIAVTLLHSLTGVAVYYLRRSKGHSPTLKESFGVVRFPSCTFFAYLFFYQNCTEASLVLIFYGTGAEVVIGVGVLFLMHSPVYYITNITAEDRFEASLHPNGNVHPVRRFLLGRQSWTSAPRDRTFVQRNALIFKDYLYPFRRFIFAELLLSFILSAVAFFRSHSSTQCLVQASLMLATLLAFLIFVIVKRPFISGLDEMVSVTMTSCQIAAVVFVVVAKATDGMTGAYAEAAGAFLIAATTVLLLKAAFDLAVFLVEHMCSRQASPDTPMLDEGYTYRDQEPSTTTNYLDMKQCTPVSVTVSNASRTTLFDDLELVLVGGRGDNRRCSRVSEVSTLFSSSPGSPHGGPLVPPPSGRSAPFQRCEL